MVVTVCMDTSTVAVSVRITVNALKRCRATSFRCPLVLCAGSAILTNTLPHPPRWLAKITLMVKVSVRTTSVVLIASRLLLTWNDLDFYVCITMQLLLSHHCHIFLVHMMLFFFSLISLCLICQCYVCSELLYFRLDTKL